MAKKEGGPQKPFKRPCLKCQKLIEIEDRTRDWICPKCRRENERVRGLRDIRDPFPEDATRHRGDI